MPRTAYLLCLCLAIICSTGCGNGSGVEVPRTCAIQGEVTLDGKPMPEGEITLEITGYAPSTLPIKDGAYSGTAFAGKNRVQIRAFKAGPPLDTDPSGPPTRINYLPERYNDETTLSAEVTPERPNNFRFTVTSR